MFSEITGFIRSVYKDDVGVIPLHAPYFGGNEEKYVLDTIRSTFVSSVGSYVDRFEQAMCDFTGSRYAVATVNGTTALHLALVVCGVKPGEEVITQSLTFVATANAIVHAGAIPVFMDVERRNLGMSAIALKDFLGTYAQVRNGACYNRLSGRRIAACVPMHTFGFPAAIRAIVDICGQYGIPVVEDAAESLGSYTSEKHTGTFGEVGVFSFNGNKTITCGGGGMIITNDERTAKLAKHLSTTAKVSKDWEFVHDQVGYNYRLPNLNAALACAQMEQLERILDSKRAIAAGYRDFFAGRKDAVFVEEEQGTKANYWLNTLLFDGQERKEAFLAYANGQGVMVRPVWRLMNALPMFKDCQTGEIKNAAWLCERVVNIPSSPIF